MENKKPPHPVAPTIPLSTSISFLLGRKQLLGWSVVLIALTIVLTWTGFLLTTGLVDH
jgi:hypothetical protein